jgi:hypothetical protein
LWGLGGTPAAAKERHLLYAASPGIRNYVEYGGVGIVVFDIDSGYKFVRRIPTWDLPSDQKVENVKGIAASAKTGIVYVSTINRMAGFDAVSGKKLWDKMFEGGCDRMAISPDGKILYTPSLEGPHWNVINALTGDVITRIEPKSGAHNTVYSLDGTRVYLAGLRSPLLSVADTETHTVVKTVGPFANSIRPFTVNGSNTLCFVNINGLLGFEVGDIRTGRKLHRVEVEGYQQGPVKRHGCPSHGRSGTCPAGSASASTGGTPTHRAATSSTRAPSASSLPCGMKPAGSFRAKKCSSWWWTTTGWSARAINSALE